MFGGRSWCHPEDLAARFAAGRGSGHRHGRGPFGFGPPWGGRGGHPPFPFFRGPRARRGDVRAGILALLREQPRNGYQIMQELEQRSGGLWRPSPGSVYPALQLLEDEGLVRVEEQAGGALRAHRQGPGVRGRAPGRGRRALEGGRRPGPRRLHRRDGAGPAAGGGRDAGVARRHAGADRRGRQGAPRSAPGAVPYPGRGFAGRRVRARRLETAAGTPGARSPHRQGAARMARPAKRRAPLRRRRPAGADARLAGDLSGGRSAVSSIHRVDRQARAAQAVHGRTLCLLMAPLRAPGAHAHPGRRPAHHRHPGGDRDLELSGPVGRRHGEARRLHHRARALDDGQRHLAHGVAVALGIGIVKVYFERGPTSGRRSPRSPVSATPSCASCRPGITPPNILQFNASNVQVAQLTVPGAAGEQELFDYGLNFLRAAPVHHPGAVDAGPLRRAPAPGDGGSRSDRLAAKGSPPRTWSTGCRATTSSCPAGNARIGGTEYDVQLNNSPTGIEFNQPCRSRWSTAPAVRLGDVAYVHDGFAVQQHRARQRPARHLPRDPAQERRLDAGGGRLGARPLPGLRPRRPRAWSSARLRSVASSCAPPSAACCARRDRRPSWSR